MKPTDVFKRANDVESAIAKESFEVRRMKKADIKRFLAMYFNASMNGEAMPDVDGENAFEWDTEEETGH